MVSGLRRKLYIAQLDASRDSIFILVGLVHLVVVHPLEVLHVLQDLDVRDVANPEDDVGVDLVIPGRHITSNQSGFRAKGLHAGERDRFFALVESVEDPLVPDLRLREDSDLGPKKVDPSILQKIGGGVQEERLGRVRYHAGHHLCSPRWLSSD